VGSCDNFQIETYKNHRENNAVVKDQTSLMCLDGCYQKLGCSIVLSGPDVMELKTVRHALIKCLKYARILFLEREYLNFLRPNLKIQPSIHPELLLDLPSDSPHSPLNNEDLINSSMIFVPSLEKDNIMAQSDSLSF
jgi:hypothetical protein